MPHSLRAKLKGLNYKKLITDRELERLCKALDNDDVLGKIRDEIEHLHHHPKLDFIKNDEVVDMALEIIDKYR